MGVCVAYDRARGGSRTHDPKLTKLVQDLGATQNCRLLLRKWERTLGETPSPMKFSQGASTNSALQ